MARKSKAMRNAESPEQEALVRLVEKKGPIALNMRLVRILGLDDLRDLFEDIHRWGYNRDFTYRDSQARCTSQEYIRRWLRESHINQ